MLEVAMALFMSAILFSNIISKGNSTNIPIPQNVLVTSCYFTVASKYGQTHNASNNIYHKWFQTALRINATYIFYYDNENNLKFLQSIRNSSYPTIWVQRNMTTFRYHNKFPPLISVWQEKFELMYITSLQYKSEWYAWIDSAINSYREYEPPSVRWPEKNLSEEYPTKKFVFHDFLGRFDIAATGFLIHKDVIGKVRDLFYIELEKCVTMYGYNDSGGKCRDEQQIMRMIHRNYPELCHDVRSIGLNWGAIVTQNYLTPHRVTAGGCKYWRGHDYSNC